jgi:DNA polymerase
MLEILKKLESEIFECRRCPRLCQINPFPMPHIYYGDLKNIELFCIGRNPGLEDCYDDIPISSFMKLYHERWWNCKIGKYLRLKLGEDVLLSKFFFTNICKCSSPKNSSLFPDEKNNCLPFLHQQLKLVKPQLIITMSNDAYQALFPEIKNMYLNLNDLKIPVVNLYHPSYFIYSGDKIKSEEQDETLKSIREIFT